jgi:two-component system, NarL family, response regulator LiaR
MESGAPHDVATNAALDHGNQPVGSGPIGVSLVNDYEIIVQGLFRMLEPFSDRIRVVEMEAGGLPSAPTDIALFDTFGGRRYSLARVKAMARDQSIGKIVLYTWDAPPAFRADVAQHSVDAVILKSETGEALVAALERVHRGESTGFDELQELGTSTTLTQREQEVLALMALGSSNREIAHELYLSVDTVKTHVRTLFQKLGVSNRTQAALAAVDFGVGPPPIRAAS